MQIDENLLRILVCPEDKSALSVASPDLLAKINAAIENGAARNRGGKIVCEKIQQGLVRADGKYIYAVRENIPVLLIDEGISLPT